MTGDAGPLDPGDAVRAELVAIEGDWARAIVSGDAGRIAGFMAADWVLVSDSGVTPHHRGDPGLTASGVRARGALTGGLARVIP